MSEGYAERDVILLFRLLDKMMALSASLQQGFKRRLRTYEEDRKMPFLSMIEEEAIASGIQQGSQQTLLGNIKIILLMRFPELPAEISDSLANISDLNVLEELLKKAVTVTSVAEFQEFLP